MKNNQSGAVLVEAAISIPVFVTLILIIFQCSIWAYTQYCLHYSTFTITRRGVVVKEFTAGVSKYDSLKQQLSEELNKFGLQSSSLELYMCDIVTNNCTTQNSGNSNSLVYIVSKIKPRNILMGKFNITLTSKILTKNEPY